MTRFLNDKLLTRCPNCNEKALTQRYSKRDDWSIVVIECTNCDYGHELQRVHN